MQATDSDTITALASPPGRGALAVLRISGRRVQEILRRRLRGPRTFVPRQVTLARLVNADGESLDRVLVVYYPSPHSYTGEDVLEIFCHGSPVLAREILQAVQLEDVRPARPGEFTMRAFLNGKLDLAQAEAVRDLVESQTLFQARVASEQLEGKLSRRLAPLKERLVWILCQMETALEFVEDEVEPERRTRLLEAASGVEAAILELLESFKVGHIVHDGFQVAIAGKPNAGKSTLFNRLLMAERAIVTDIPGTTRDALAESINLGGIPVRLVDTAGLQHSQELVQQLGVQRSLEAFRESDLILFVVDGSRPYGEADGRVWGVISKRPVVVVVNKSDLGEVGKLPSEVERNSLERVRVSARTGAGVAALKEAISAAMLPAGGIETETVMVTGQRHRRCLQEAHRHLHSGMEALRQGMSEEFPAYDFRKCLEALGEITGETTVEDLLERIFATFCIGK